MSEHANKREKRLAMLVVAAVVLVTVLLIVETFRLLLPGLWSAFSAGDEQALKEAVKESVTQLCRLSFRPCRCSWRQGWPTARGWAF